MRQIYSQFQFDGIVISCSRYRNGHINETYLVVTSKNIRYILQNVNTSIFKNIDVLMDENDIVTFTLANRPIEIGGWMGKEPGDITPLFDYTEKKLS